MESATVAAAALAAGLTVRQHFAQSMRQYDRIVESSADSTDATLQQEVRACIAVMHEFWRHMASCGVLSSNDELDDISTPTLAMLTVPYIIGDLHLRLVDSTIPREKLLEFADHYFRQFLKVMVDLEIISEKEAEIGTNVSPANRTARVELSRAQTALRQKLTRIDDRIGFLRARDRRLRQLQQEEDLKGEALEGDALEEAADGEEGSELEELMRERAMTHLRWCIGDCFAQTQSLSREAELLRAIPAERRQQLAEEYQRGIELTRSGANSTGRGTYVILPGGQIATDGADGSTLLRQRYRDEAFINRIQPTMTLEEFAEQEIAFVRGQEQQQLEGQLRLAEEDARLGPEGVEERERQKQAKWDDWRDDNPPIGITAKGNYS